MGAHPAAHWTLPIFYLVDCSLKNRLRSFIVFGSRLSCRLGRGDGEHGGHPHPQNDRYNPPGFHDRPPGPGTLGLGSMEIMTPIFTPPCDVHHSPWCINHRRQFPSLLADASTAPTKAKAAPGTEARLQA